LICGTIARDGDCTRCSALTLRIGHHGVCDRLQLGVIAVAVAQFDLHGKAGGIADALDRRRQQHQRAGLHDRG
jgi:hypothetical protein